MHVSLSLCTTAAGFPFCLHSTSITAAAASAPLARALVDASRRRLYAVMRSVKWSVKRVQGRVGGQRRWNGNDGSRMPRLLNSERRAQAANAAAKRANLCDHWKRRKNQKHVVGIGAGAMRARRPDPQRFTKTHTLAFRNAVLPHS